MDLDQIKPGALLYASQIAALFRLSRQLVAKWVKLGHLTAVDSRKGRPRYRLEDALEAEARTRRSPRSHRLAVA